MVELMVYYFYYGRNDMPLDVTANVIFVFLEALVLKIPCCIGIVNTFELVVC